VPHDFSEALHVYSLFFAVFIPVSFLAGMDVHERQQLGTGYSSPPAGFMVRGLVDAVTLSLILWSRALVTAPYGRFILSGVRRSRVRSRVCRSGC
jgi:hypothetical protein